VPSPGFSVAGGEPRVLRPRTQRDGSPGGSSSNNRPATGPTNRGTDSAGTAPPGRPGPVNTTFPRRGAGVLNRVDQPDTADTGAGAAKPPGPNASPSQVHTGNTPHTAPPDGPPTVGGGEKTRGNRDHDGQLKTWDDQQQRWRPIAQTGAPSSGSDALTGTPPTGQTQPHISDLDQIFPGEPDQARRYQQLSTQPADQLTPDELKFVHNTRQQITLNRGEPMTKVLSPDAVDKTIHGPFAPNRVIGFVARARDTDQLRTPLQLREGLALNPPPGASWTPAIPADDSYAYQMTWNAKDPTDGLSVPYGVPDGRPVPSHISSTVPGGLRSDGAPYTGTGTTAGGIPEWRAQDAPITGPAQIWRIDKNGNRTLYAHYEPGTKAWRLDH
jgi:hypothetical protein